MIVTCDDILKDCVFKGKVRNCSQLFVFEATDVGLCCSFNTDETGWTIDESEKYNETHCSFVIDEYKKKFIDLI